MNKKLFIIGVLLSAVLISPLYAVPPKVGKIEPLNFSPQEPERVVLSNGVVVFLLEDHELPLFSLNLKMKVSPQDVEGYSRSTLGFFGAVWRSGGTKKRDPDELNEELEFMPATVETGAGEESISISLSCLSRDIVQGLEIFQDVLFHPQFRKGKLKLAKSSSFESLRRKNETPRAIASRAFRDVLYGPDHYYALNATEKTIKQVKRRDLARLHKALVHPDKAIVAISGDFEKEKILKELETLFQNWKPSGRVVPEFDYSIHLRKEGDIFTVEKDFNQSRISIGKIGLSRFDEDRFSLVVGNYILGGAGTSRLFGEIRSRLGLAYVVGSFFSNPKGPGIVAVGCQTKAETTTETLSALLKEMDKMTEAAPTQEEIQLAKDAILNSFIFQFESTSHIVNEQAKLEFLGYPKGYLNLYPDKIRAVTREDVLRVSKTYFSSENRRILVVGDPTKFATPLTDVAPVTKIPLKEID